MMNQSRQVVSPLQLNGRRAVHVDLCRIELLFEELAARVTVEEAENDLQDGELELQGAELELQGAELESLSATVLGFADEVSTDAISAATDGGGVSVGASLLPEPDTALGSETHGWADLFAADVTLDGESLTETLQALRDSIAAVDP
jgi:hypothetical protein